MKKAFIECVINISEGRDTAKISQILDIFNSVNDVLVVHKDVGFDANRTVFTLLGEMESVFLAVDMAISYAVTSFEIASHEGTHPRIGILDVIPFIPIQGINQDELRESVKGFSTKIGKRYNLPILYYGSLSEREHQKTLHDLRRHSIEKTLGQSIISDCGPQKPHPTLGASCVTVREIMIAFNINLDTKDLALSKRLAQQLLLLRRTQETVQDISQVKFLAWYVDEYQCCQISTNIYDIEAITMLDVYELVEEQAEIFDIKLKGSELIGMAPWRAITKSVELRDNDVSKLGLDSVRPFHIKHQVLDFFLEQLV